MSDPYREPGMPSLDERIMRAQAKLDYYLLTNAHGRTRRELDELRRGAIHARAQLNALLEEKRKLVTP